MPLETLPMPAPSWRSLTPGELALVAEVFGNGLAATRVRMICLPLITRIFTPGSWAVVWPKGEAVTDFVQADLVRQATFIHEMAHVQQAQRGVFLPLAKLRAGDRAQDYDYDEPPGRAFEALNIEQQATFIEHAFLASRGGATRHSLAHYAALEHRWRSA